MDKNIEKIALDEISSESNEAGKPLVSRDLNLVGHVNVQVKVHVGTLDVSIEKLFSMKEGEVLKMNEGANAPVTLYVDEKPVATGNLVAVDDNFGVQIKDILK